jgi:excisionase family DNA binding protein
MEKLLTVEEAAELLRIMPRTLKEWCRRGKVPCVKVGQLWRLKASELEAWMRPHLRVVKSPEAEDQADVEAARQPRHGRGMRE